MEYELLSTITEIETIAVGRSIRDIARLRKYYGRGRWRKMKGIVQVRLPDGTIAWAEVHWYEHMELAEKKLRLNDYLEYKRLQ